MSADAIRNIGTAVWYGIEETAYGTETASYAVCLSAISAEVTVDPSYTPRQDAFQDSAAGLVASAYIPGRNVVRVTTEHYLTYGGMGMLLGAIVGGTPSFDTDDPSSGINQTAWLLAKDPHDSLSIRIKDGEALGSLTTEEREALGCVIDSATITVPSQGAATISCEWMAQSAKAWDTATSVTITNATENRVHSHHAGTISWNSATYAFVECTLTIRRAPNFRDAAGSANTAQPYSSNLFEIELSVTMDRIGSAFSDALEADTKSNLVLTFTDPSVTNQDWTFTLHGARVAGPPSVTKGAFEISRETIRFVPTGGGASAPGLLMETHNTDSAAEAA